jgi:integrase
VPYSEVGDFVFALRSHKSISARALEFLILTGVRSGSVRLAQWTEIDIDNALWTIPAAHTKTRQIHRVPLSKQSIKLLKELPKIKGQTHIFPSAKGKALSDMALSKLMKDMRQRNEFKTDGVPHGFRSTFRDWAADQTNYPDELRKIASGHKVGDSVLQSYQRTDLLDKRRRLMTDWANFLDKPSVRKSSKVVQIRKKA